MTERPSQRELDRLLADLPRESASPAFSRRVLESLDAPRSSAAGRRRLLAAASVAAALVAAVLLLPRETPPPDLAETRELEEQHRLLMEELQELKASLRDSRAAAPLLYLGGNENVELVLDLGPVWRDEPVAGARPAVFGGAEPPVAADQRHRGERR